MTSAEKVKLQIDQAMRSRHAHVAALVDDSLRNTLDLIDEQSAAVIEEMIAHGRQL